MRSFVTRALLGTLLAGGITLLGATVANATETSGEDGLLSGTQALLNIKAPVTLVGNAISVLGDSSSSRWAAEPASAPEAGPSGATTSGAGGIGSGSQAVIDVTVPVTISGLAVSVVGDSESTGAAAAAGVVPAAAPAPVTTSGVHGLLSGTQALISVTAPITVSGNAVSVLGDSRATGAPAAPAAEATPAGMPAGTTGTTGADGILSGTQVIPGVVAPLTVAGNAISVLGASTTTTPSAPTAPMVPLDPAAPSEPAAPTAPAAPSDPAVPANPGDSPGANAVVAAPTGSTVLAATGSSGALVALVAGLALAGLGGTLMARRTA